MSNTIETYNPYTGKKLDSYERLDDAQLQELLEKGENTFQQWKGQAIKERTALLEKLSQLLEERKSNYANLISEEMGKPFTESISEIEKCVSLIEFYVVNAERFLSDELIETDARESFVSYDPLGCILGIMPWNFPFWQVMRFAIPTLTAGNTVFVKHADNVTGCALAMEQLFQAAGYPEGCFTIVLATHEQIAKQFIADDRIKAISLTGSEKAGKEVAATAGSYLKKTVLELGGNNACIIWEDAILEKHISTIVKARMLNAGQSCIAAKRYIVMADIYEEFLEKVKTELERFLPGDPLDPHTTFGVLANEKFAEKVAEQVKDAVDQGASILVGNHAKGAFFAPTILTDVQPGMKVFDEEVFGPVIAITKAKDRQETIALASQTRFGLGTMLFTEDVDAARKEIDAIADGAFFINDLVKSDPRLPFGGTKASGYGRELSKEGIQEFTNKKTVYIK